MSERPVKVGELLANIFDTKLGRDVIYNNEFDGERYETYDSADGKMGDSTLA